MSASDTILDALTNLSQAESHAVALIGRDGEEGQSADVAPRRIDRGIASPGRASQTEDLSRWRKDELVDEVLRLRSQLSEASSPFSVDTAGAVPGRDRVGRASRAGSSTDPLADSLVDMAPEAPRAKRAKLPKDQQTGKRIGDERRPALSKAVRAAVCLSC